MNFPSKFQYTVTVLLMILLNCNTSLFSQVTIGTEEKPVEGALLQLKTIENATGNAPNANKGLLMPRVSLSDKYELFPMFLADPANPESGRSTEYETNKESLDKSHTGLIVYNTSENYKKALCLGMNVWDGKMWQCLNDPKYSYEIQCESVEVHGIYRKGTTLDNSNKITLNIVTSDPLAVGKPYFIRTEKMDGIQFFGEGTITNEALGASGQTVTLYGEGSPSNREIKYLTLSGNNLSGNTCLAKVYVAIPKKRILVLGTVDLYGWVPGRSGFGSYEVLKSPKNFGNGTNMTDPVFPIEDIEIIYPNINDLPNATQANAITNYLETEKVDICYIGQNFKLSGTSTHIVNLQKTLANYVKSKGVLLLFWEGNDGYGVSIRDFFRVLFENQSIMHQRVRPSDGGGGIFKVSDVKDDITNGPFGNASGKHWGEDASWAVSVSMPTTDVEVYSWGDDLTFIPTSGQSEPVNNVTGFKHKHYNLVYFGDGGFPSSIYSTGGNTSASNLICPFSWNPTTMHPTPKKNYGYGSGQRYDVYNSIIWCNTMAWAFYQAEINGINPPND